MSMSVSRAESVALQDEIIRVKAQVQDLMGQIETTLKQIAKESIGLGNGRDRHDTSTSLLVGEEVRKIVHLETQLDEVDEKLRVIRSSIGDEKKFVEPLAAQKDYIKLRKAGFILVQKSVCHSHSILIENKPFLVYISNGTGPTRHCTYGENNDCARYLGYTSDSVVIARNMELLKNSSGEYYKP